MEIQRISGKLHEEKQALNSELFELKKHIVELKGDNESLTKEVAKFQDEISSKSKQ